MSDVKVCKFGGTSVATAAQMRKVKAIIEADPARRIIVPSAPGRAHSDDAKVTDLLYLTHEMASNQQDIGPVWNRIVERFQGLVSDLGLDLDLSATLEEVRARIQSGAGADYAASRGEALNGLIVAALLGATYIDAAEVVRIAPGRRIDPASHALIRAACADDAQRYVIPGFYGSDQHGQVLTFSRGGSDVSGALAAAALDAAVYENWTDVSGVLAADPRIVSGSRTIAEITYGELREMAYMGASVLHDEAVFPVRERGIPINIRNTDRPDDPGTMIVNRREPGDQIVVGIAGRAGFTVFALEKMMMNVEVGFGRRVLDVFERFGIAYEHTPTGIDTMSVVVADEAIGEGRGEAIAEELRAAVHPERLDILPGMALVATVGLGMNHHVGVAGRLFSALAQAQVNVRMIDQGSSEQNIIIGVEADDLHKAITTIYQEFIAS